MKKFILLFLFTMSVFGAIAQPRTALTIQSTRHESFWIYVNEALQNKDEVKSITILNMAPENYTVRIILKNKSYSEVTLALQLRGGNNNYELDYDTRSRRLTLRPVDYSIHAEIVTPLVIPSVNDERDVLGTRHGRNSQNNHRGWQNSGYQPQDEHPHNGTGHGNNRHDNHGDIHHDGHHEQEIPTVVVVQEPPQQPMPCPTATFQKIEQLIQNQSFEESKLTIAKQAISNELMTAEQLKSIAQLFTFEDSKLELLKFAYDYCFDPENYYYVNGAFTFSSSIEELNEYITNHH